jgi:hypothetical protein
MLARTKVLDEANESLRLNGLAHNGYGTGFLGYLRNVAASRHDHDRNVGKKGILGPLGEKSPAIEYWHQQVQKNQRGTSLRVLK